MASPPDAATAAVWRRRLPRRAAHAALALAVAGLLTLALLHVGGYRPLVVYSDSMAPRVAAGDLIVTQAVRPAAVAVGDVVSFHDPSRAERLVTHRVKQIRRDGGEIAFVTRGDANGAVERWSTATDARVGRLAVRIPLAGYAVTWLTRLPIILGLLAVVTLLFTRALVGARQAPGAARVVSRSLLAALASSATILTLPLTVAATEGAFSAVTMNGGNSFEAAASFCAAGGQVTTIASGDAFVNQGSPTAADGNDPDGLGVNSSPGQNWRTLVKFALPTAPAGCTVSSAVLRLTAYTSFPGRTLQAKRVTGGWLETAVTWNNQPPASAVDVATAPSASGTIGFDVKLQLAAGASNGFLIRDASEDAGGFTYQVYRSRESSDPALVPKLIITYA